MSNERNATKAGLFIVVSALLVVGVILTIEGGGHLSEPRHHRAIRFKLSDDLGGLRIGDEVRVGGYKVGSVVSIEPAGLDGADPHLRVEVSIPDRYRLRPDAAIGVQVTLTGAACVNVESLGSASSPEAAGELVGRPDPKTVALSSLARAGGDIEGITHDVRTSTIPKVNATVDAFHQTGQAGTQLVQHVDAKIEPVVGKYDVVTEKTGRMVDSIHEMIGPSTKDFHGTMADLHEVTTGLKGRLPEMFEKIDAAIDGTRNALEGVQQTVANTKEISASVREVISGNKGKLDGMIVSAKATADNLKAASIEIRHSPWRLLYRPSNGEISNLNVYDSARQFAEGATELNDAAQALRDASKDKQADPAKVQQLINRLEKTFANFQNVEKKLWTDVKE